jgi:hypothetical protein
MAYPIRGEVDPAAVAAHLNLFLYHLLAIDLELHAPLSGLAISCRFIIFYPFLVRHYNLPISYRADRIDILFSNNRYDILAIM